MAKNKEKEIVNPNTPEEKSFVCQIDTWQTNAEGGVREESQNYWGDEYLAFKGDHWDMSVAPRSEEAKRYRPNSVDNYILPTIKNIHDSLTTSMPEGKFEGREVSDDQTADKLSDIVSFINYKNRFRKQWKDIVLQGLKYGPFVGSVLWDPHWVGGTGPNRWIGDIRIANQKKDEIFFDPAILDLEERLQECSFINRKFRKKLDWIRERWPEVGKSVTDDIDMYPSADDSDEGMNPEQATLIECWHKGTPKFVSKEWKEWFIEKAQDKLEAGLQYDAEKYADMAKGTYKGVHVAYKAGGVLLEYIPYIYDDGLYPFVYKVLYKDEKNPYGFGEIRNLLIPQVLHNKADEIEIEAMSVEGLGGYFYQKGSLSETQKREYVKNAHKGGVLQEVNNLQGIEKRVGTQTPQSLIQYKAEKKIVIDTVSQNTAIMQGNTVGANTPYSTIAELGARADVRNKGKVEILEDFLEELYQLVISRIAQFYDEEREYRIRGEKTGLIKNVIYDAIEQIAQFADPQQQLQAMQQLVMTIQSQQEDTTQRFGKFSNTEMLRSWERDGKQEEYIPEFDIQVKVVDERPTSRQYYETLATNMFGRAMGPKSFWKTIEDGKLPPAVEILKELEEIAQVQAQAQEQTQPQQGAAQ